MRKRVALPPVDFELLDEAIELFGRGEYTEALRTALRHRFPTRDIPEGEAGTFSYLQGSAQVTLRWDTQGLRLSVPLVTLPEGGRAIAALRYLLTEMGGWGQMLHPRLRGEDVTLECEDGLSRSHPVKLLQLLADAPLQADRVDDWMVNQFGAIPLGEGSVTPLDTDELARAELIWSTHWGEVAELIREIQRKRSMFLLNEVTAYAYYHVRQALPLSGYLGTRLTESANTFTNNDEEPDKRLTVLAKSAKEFVAISAEELAKNLGHAHYAISPLDEGSGQTLHNYLGNESYMQRLDKLRKSGDLLIVTVGLLSTFHFLLDRWSWPEPIESLLLQGIERASGKPWREAVDILWEQAAAVVSVTHDLEEDDDDDGQDKQEDMEVRS